MGRATRGILQRTRSAYYYKELSVRCTSGLSLSNISGRRLSSMPFGADPIVLTEHERRELRQITQSRTLPAGDVMRARMILQLSEGASYRRIQSLLYTTAPTISPSTRLCFA